MLRAIVSSEDARFYEHDGVDPKGVMRAFVANQRAGGVSQGASTLTMQYVRNVQRDSAETPQQVTEATEQSNGRKLREMRLAIAVEKEMSKEQILERYLNVAYFGHRAYGIFAAAEVYFSKKPKDLTLAEAAMLAGLVKAPSAYDPASRDQTAALERRNYVHRPDDRDQVPLAGTGRADQGRADRTTAIGPAQRLHLGGPGAQRLGLLLRHVQELVAQPARVRGNPQQREENLRRGGYRIVTSLDPNLQQIAMSEVTSKERIGSSYALGLVAVQPGTGRIQAAAVNRVYSLDQSRNGRHSRRPPPGPAGSSSYPNTVAPLLGGG